ncbi:hypothetical protein TTHERM_000221189 (macronuclear) [Tetrahymena thermophila SB210]|uniref:Uncharacterized protein n=1 Tax=Tetrahymena thermophila (strain SB210) TaxID=312017 RepID=W7XGM3_TETTS|nr:hypothetical protein TTHERM_000221189 [Tetrahymena thermophila SB210]EWS73296.1 hypothetical protein TTHERM_000221189 [Tetrahymena thermophila SB210]|eukprot:XP_012654205.1 hypothetical protein TTHERM_000221189 [Tetrahymena thermophila SB210]
MYKMYSEEESFDGSQNNKLNIEFPKNQDLLKVMQSISQLPLCSEKILLELIEQSLLIKLTNQTLKREINCIDEQKQNLLLNIIKQLEEQLLIDYNNQLDFRKIAENLKIFVQSQNSEQILICCQCLMKIIKPLDIDILQQFELEYQDNSNLYYGQDIILFLGTNESDKSKVIQQIAGSKIQEKNNEIRFNKGQKQPVFNLIQKQAQKITFEFKKELEAFQFLTQPVLLKERESLTEKSIILCKIPNFKELIETETEIACIIGIDLIMKKCKSIRPFILYQKNQENGEEIFSLCSLLSNLVNNIPDKISCFSYIFTEFPINENIHEYLKNLKESNLFKENKNFNQNALLILEDMIEKTKKDVLRIDSQNNPQVLILKQLLKESEIQNSFGIFKFSLSENAKTNILNQVKLHKENIISAINRNDYKLIGYRLNQLKFLIKNQLQDFALQTYQECIKVLISELTQNYTKVTQSFNNILNNQIKLSSEDLLCYKQLIQQLQEVENLRQDHLQNLSINASAAVKNLKDTLKNVKVDLNLNSINSQQTINKIQNIKFFTQEFPEIQQKMTDLCQEVQFKIENLVIDCQKVLKNNNFHQIISLLTEIKTFSEFCKNYLNEKYCLDKYENTVYSFKNHLDELIKSQSQLLLKYILENEDLDKIEQMFSFIDQLQSIGELKKHIKVNYIQKLRQILLSYVIQYYQKISQRIYQILSDQSINCFKECEILIDQMYKIKKIKGLENVTSEIFENTLEKISQKLEFLKQNIKNNLILDQNLLNINFFQISNTVNQLKEAQWIDQYHKSKMYDNMIKEISENLRQFYLSIQIQITELNLNVKNLQNYKTASQLLQQLVKMSPLDALDGKLIEYRTYSQQKFIESIDQNLTKIQQFLNLNLKNTSCQERQILEENSNDISLQKLDLKLVERYLNFLKFCLKGNYCEERASQIKTDLNKQIQQYGDDLNQEISKTFKKIENAKVINIKEIPYNCQKLAQLLQDLSDLEEYPKVFKLVKGQNLIKKYRSNIKQFIFKLNIDDIYPPYFDVEEVKLKIMLQKSLGLIEFFVGENKIFDRSSEFQSLLNEKYKQDKENIFLQIEKHNFIQVYQELLNNEFNESLNKQIKTEIHFQIHKLLDHAYQQAITLSRKLEKDLIVSLVENLKKIQQVQLIFSKDIKIQTEQNMIEQQRQQSKIKQIYMEKINSFLELIRAQIFNFEFYEAENQIEHIKEINQILQIIDEHNEISQAIQQIQLSIQQRINGLLEQYNTQENSFLLHPPKIIQQKLSKALKKNIQYDEIYNKFMQKVFEIIQKLIIDLQDKSAQDRQQCIQRLIVIYNNVQDDLKIKFETEIAKLKNDFDFNQLFEYIQSKYFNTYKFNLEQNYNQKYQE